MTPLLATYTAAHGVALAPFSSFVDLLTEIEDPRRAEGKLYRLPHVVLFAILAIVAGANSYPQLPRWKSCKLLNCFPDRSWGGGATGYKLSPSNWNALCWVGVGLVTMVSGYFGVIAVTMVF